MSLPPKPGEKRAKKRPKPLVQSHSALPGQLSFLGFGVPEVPRA